METATAFFLTLGVVVLAFVLGVILGIVIMVIARAGKTYDERAAFLMDAKDFDSKMKQHSKLRKV